MNSAFSSALPWHPSKVCSTALISSSQFGSRAGARSSGGNLLGLVASVVTRSTADSLEVSCFYFEPAKSYGVLRPIAFLVHCRRVSAVGTFGNEADLTLLALFMRKL